MTKVETTATFPRSARLLTPTAFNAVFEKRRARRGRFFHLHVGGDKRPLTAVEDPPLCRIGIAIPKKLLKTAVHRNLLKRIAREVFRRLRTTLDQRDYVLRLSVKVEPKKKTLDRNALASDIRALFAVWRSPPRLSDSPAGSPVSPPAEGPSAC